MSVQQKALEQLQELQSDWETFAELPNAVLCCMKIRPIEQNLFQAFLTYENMEEGNLPDWFIQVSPYFNTEEDFTQNIIASLKGKLADMALDWDQEEDVFDNPVFVPNEDATEPVHLVKALEFLQKKTQPLQSYRHLVLVVSPTTESQFESWCNWWEKLLRVPQPEGIKYLVTETPEGKSLIELDSLFPGVIEFLEPELDMEGLLTEMAATGNPREPGVQYRKAMTAMTLAQQANNQDEAQEHADKAISIAQKQDWYDLMAAIHISMGNMHLTSGNHEEAVESFSKAVVFSKEGKQKGQPVCEIMEVQSQLVLGSACVGAGSYQEASEAYKEAAQLAKSGDTQTLLIYHLEGLRMQAWCLAQLKEEYDAWDLNAEVFSQAKEMQELGYNHMLPFIGKEMKSLSKKLGYRDKFIPYEDTLEDLFGENWEQTSENQPVRL